MHNSIVNFMSINNETFFRLRIIYIIETKYKNKIIFVRFDDEFAFDIE